MRENRDRNEPRSSVCVEQPETDIEAAIREAYEKGYDDGFEEARESFIQTQMLLSHTGGSA
jgi:hypothetical protein